MAVQNTQQNEQNSTNLPVNTTEVTRNKKISTIAAVTVGFLFVGFSALYLGFFLGVKFHDSYSLVNKPTPSINPILSPTSSPTLPVSSIPSQSDTLTVDWNNYINEEYKLTFKYPPEWVKQGNLLENYNNPNKERGFGDECLINYKEGFLIDDSVETRWGPLNAGFGIEISVTNPENWSLDQWIQACRGWLVEQENFQRKEAQIGNKSFIAYSREEEPGNGGVATEHVYYIENDGKFYTFSFQNYALIEGGITWAGELLKTIEFL